MVQEGCPFTPAACADPAQFDPWSARNMRLSPTAAPPRRRAPPATARRSPRRYRSGLVFTGDIDIPVIDWRHYLEDQLDMHNSHQSFASRQRMLEPRRPRRQPGHLVHRRPPGGRLRPDAAGAGGDRRVDGEHPRAPAPRRGRQQAGRRPSTAASTRPAAEIAAGPDGVGRHPGRPRRPARAPQRFPLYGTSRTVAGGPIEGGVFACDRQSVAAAIARGVYGSWRPTRGRTRPAGADLPDGRLPLLTAVPLTLSSQPLYRAGTLTYPVKFSPPPPGGLCSWCRSGRWSTGAFRSPAASRVGHREAAALPAIAGHRAGLRAHRSAGAGPDPRPLPRRQREPAAVDRPHRLGLRDASSTGTPTARDRIDLVCHGLDTVATVTLNGVEVGTHRQHAPLVPVRRHATSCGPAATASRSGSTRCTGTATRSGRRSGSGRTSAATSRCPYVRKMACNFGWDWGPDPGHRRDLAADRPGDLVGGAVGRGPSGGHRRSMAHSGRVTVRAARCSDGPVNAVTLRCVLVGDHTVALDLDAGHVRRRP